MNSLVVVCVGSRVVSCGMKNVCHSFDLKYITLINATCNLKEVVKIVGSFQRQSVAFA
jgi:hypothetical protein